MLKCRSDRAIPRYSTTPPLPLYFQQDGSEEPSVPFVPGSRNVSIPSHLGHVANGESDGTVQDRLPRSAALDEGRISGTGSGHS